MKRQINIYSHFIHILMYWAHAHCTLAYAVLAAVAEATEMSNILARFSSLQ